VASGFTLAMYPWVYEARYEGDGRWGEEYVEKPHRSPREEAALGEAERRELLARRNSFPELPLVNYTTQYGLGCFEGLKALPQKDGALRVFRPDRNGARMARSMEGLRMPPFPEERFVRAVLEVVRRNRDLGFAPEYDPDWEKDDFLRGTAVYIRPFTYAEPGIGLGLSSYPWVVVVTTPVGSYFDPDARSKAITTHRIRATSGGTGWIKCNANYVVPIIAKKEANEQGYMEAIFLDAAEKRYVEEGSSCNIFFLLDDDTLVTPNLEDTILPGINRESVLTLAADMNVKTEERRITIDEVLDRAREAFVTGTAAGVSHIESITHGESTAVFNGGEIGPLTRELRKTLRGIQYGAIEDTHGWLYEV